MTEHLSQKQLQGFCRGRLSVTELLSVSDHLDLCKECRAKLETVMNGDTAFFAVRSEVFQPDSASAHATVEQTASYVDGTLIGDELKSVSDHLSRCEQCTQASDDLRAFKDRVADQLNIEYSPPPIHARTERRRRLSFFQLFGLRYPAFAVAALTILVVVLAGWLIWRSARTEPIQQEIAVSAPPTQQEPLTAEVPIVARLNDSDGSVTLNHAGQLSGVEKLPLAYQNIVKDVLRVQRIEASPLLEGLVRPSSPLMSTEHDGNNFAVIEPAGKVLLTDRPTFRWSALAGASVYTVEIYDGRLNLVIASPELTAYSWAPPKSLVRGRIYSWQVKSIKDDKAVVAPRPPASQAKFRIVDNATADALAEARRSFASSHLLLGTMYAKAGLLDEARQEFHELQKANPDSEIVRKLLASLTPPRR